MLNRIVHKTLFTNEIMQYERNPKATITDDKKLKVTDPKNLKYEIDGVPQE